MKWVKLTTAPSQPIAEMWCELLRNEGVPAFVKIPDGVAVVYSIPSLVGYWVMVPEEREDEAAALLLELTGGEAHIEPD
jgi:hypothetical protein